MKTSKAKEAASSSAPCDPRGKAMFSLSDVARLLNAAGAAFTHGEQLAHCRHQISILARWIAGSVKRLRNGSSPKVAMEVSLVAKLSRAGG